MIKNQDQLHIMKIDDLHGKRASWVLGSAINNEYEEKYDKPQG